MPKRGQAPQKSVLFPLVYWFVIVTRISAPIGLQMHKNQLGNEILLAFKAELLYLGKLGSGTLKIQVKPTQSSTRLITCAYYSYKFNNLDGSYVTCLLAARKRVST